MQAHDEDFTLTAPSGSLIVIRAAEPITIGSAESCDVRLDDKDIATVHVRFAAGFIEALSKCTVGGIALEAGQRRKLAVATTLRIGSSELRLRRSGLDASTRRLALQMVQLMLPTLVVVEGVELERRLELVDEGRDYLIGRASKCDLVLEDTRVSREHAIVTRRAERIFVRDLGSRRGTILGGAKLDRQRRAFWSAGQMLLVGSHVVACRMAADADTWELTEPSASPAEDGGNELPSVDATPISGDKAPASDPREVVEIVDNDPTPGQEPVAPASTNSTDAAPVESAPLPIEPPAAGRYRPRPVDILVFALGGVMIVVAILALVVLVFG